LNAIGIRRIAQSRQFRCEGPGSPAPEAAIKKERAGRPARSLTNQALINQMRQRGQQQKRHNVSDLDHRIDSRTGG
jgi:hypothetical protein